MLFPKHESHFSASWRIRRDKNQAFTLIELLVVIVIIGILATLATVALTSSRSKARDARRISDLKQISTGLELYYADNNAYPTTITFGSALVGANSKTYMAKVPTNPTPRAEGACADLEYRYAGSASDYSLIGCLAKASGEASAGARVLSVGGTARNLGPTNGIIGWWMLDGLSGTRDLAGNSLNGVNVGGVTTSTGRFGESLGAYSFDGSNDYVNIGNNTILHNQDFTITFWANANVIEANAGIFGTSGYGSNLGIGLYISNSQNIYSGNGAVLQYTGWVQNMLSTGWHYYAVTKAGSLVSFYKNNSIWDTRNTLTNPTNYTGVSWYIGQAQGTVYNFNGSISDFRMFNRALSDAEVTALWTATKP